jgi:transcription factor WhiB
MITRSSRNLGAKPGGLTDRELTTRVVSPLAKCTGAAVDPDEWFPVAAAPEAARMEAARALALCAVCPVRAECLELSMRRWNTIGRHGILGGFVEAERGALRARWLAGTPVTTLLRARAMDLSEPDRYGQRERPKKNGQRADADRARAPRKRAPRQPARVLPAHGVTAYGRTAPSKLSLNQPLNATFSTTAPVCGASISIPPPT